jgi:hypothetical protein
VELCDVVCDCRRGGVRRLEGEVGGVVCSFERVTLLELCPVLLMSVPSTSKLISVDIATDFGNLLDL